ncbi:MULTISPECIES: chemotaxis protein CheW [unclassified Butyrivibrio]|uniref:chemotaxis protein CheW n=1 Tax=unclassified Butyrivibrio TaxID=2639466 RepID=UPI0003B76FAD|nr:MULTISPECIES: chemotaxis protein CheW [unclassified Butyrivibrio]SDB39245.1 purine-binding chemotaxis protein CheW [Butyrivibrio sp. INlla16]SEK43724.1 purine-binding chemotaxis protein CheW [Butyrivibrio sp. ob235]
MNELRDTQDVGELIQYIIIRLGDEQYGIDIKYIDNIVRMQQITRVPQVAHYLKGVINIRGVIVPVMSLRLKMDMEPDEITDKSRIIILKAEEDTLIGIIVDQVNQVLTLGSKSIEKVTYSADKGKKLNSFISGVGKYEGGLVSILDLGMVEMEDDKAKA